jgi:hypothetical protein
LNLQLKLPHTHSERERERDRQNTNQKVLSALSEEKRNALKHRPYREARLLSWFFFLKKKKLKKLKKEAKIG